MKKQNNLNMACSAFGILLLTLVSSSCKKNNDGGNGINKVNHVVVIYMENHSFDNLYGSFSGANGLQNANASNETQVDSAGIPYTVLPAHQPSLPTCQTAFSTSTSM